MPLGENNRRPTSSGSPSSHALKPGDLGKRRTPLQFEHTGTRELVAEDFVYAIKRVADALDIPIANGEQDQSFVNFRWLIANDGLEIVQPDSYYFGGLIRCVKVGRMAAAFGKSIVPHMSGGGLGFLYNSHLVSVLPNAGAHHPFQEAHGHHNGHRGPRRRCHR